MSLYQEPVASTSTLMDREGRLLENISREEFINVVVPRLITCKAFYHPCSHKPFMYFQGKGKDLDTSDDLSHGFENRTAFLRVAPNHYESVFLFKKVAYESEFEMDTGGFYEIVYYDSHGVPVISTNPDSTLCTGVPDYSYIKHLRLNKSYGKKDESDDSDEIYNNVDEIEAGDDKHYNKLVNYLVSGRKGIQNLSLQDDGDLESEISTPFSALSSDDGFFECKAAGYDSKLATGKELDLEEGSSSYPLQDSVDEHFERIESPGLPVAQPPSAAYDSKEFEHQGEEHHEDMIDLFFNRTGVYEVIPKEKHQTVEPIDIPKTETPKPKSPYYDPSKELINDLEELMDSGTYEGFVNRLFDRFGYMHEFRSRFHYK